MSASPVTPTRQSVFKQIDESILFQQAELKQGISVEKVEEYVRRCETWQRIGELDRVYSEKVGRHINDLLTYQARLQRDVQLFEDPNFNHVNLIVTFLLRNESKLEEDGFVTASGNHRVFHQLAVEIKQGQIRDGNQLYAYSGVDLFKALGTLIGGLANPIIPDEWAVVLESSSASDDREAQEAIQQKWSQFPQANRHLFEKMMHLAILVHQKHHKEKINLANIAKMIGPLLFRKENPRLSKMVEEDPNVWIQALTQRLKFTEWLLKKRVNINAEGDLAPPVPQQIPEWGQEQSVVRLGHPPNGVSESAEAGVSKELHQAAPPPATSPKPPPPPSKAPPPVPATRPPNGRKTVEGQTSQPPPSAPPPVAIFRHRENKSAAVTVPQKRPESMLKEETGLVEEPRSSTAPLAPPPATPPPAPPPPTKRRSGDQVVIEKKEEQTPSPDLNLPSVSSLNPEKCVAMPPPLPPETLGVGMEGQVEQKGPDPHGTSQVPPLPPSPKMKKIKKKKVIKKVKKTKSTSEGNSLTASANVQRTREVVVDKLGIPQGIVSEMQRKFTH